MMYIDDMMHENEFYYVNGKYLFNTGNEAIILDL